jgi:hypothetical protein
MKKLLTALVALGICAAMAGPSFADGGTTGLKARKICDKSGATGEALKSCCENQTFNTNNEAKEAAICMKGGSPKKAEKKITKKDAGEVEKNPK